MVGVDIAADFEELGAQLRALREECGLSLRRLAELVPLSKSRIGRLEHGTGWENVSPQVVAQVDSTLDGGGVLSQAFLSILGVVEDPSTAWEHFFPRNYKGRVALVATPTPAAAGTGHILQIRWGPWRRRWRATLSNAGASFWFTKGDDTTSVPIFVRVLPPARIAFLIEPEVPMDAHDLNFGWTLEEVDWLRRRLDSWGPNEVEGVLAALDSPQLEDLVHLAREILRQASER